MLKKWLNVCHPTILQTLTVSSGFVDAPPRGGILVMKNDDVYSVAGSTDDLKLLGIPGCAEALPLQAAKIETLCGKGIMRKH